MASQDSRPVNLDLSKFSFPITAIASITHRVCAVISWVAIAALLYVASASKGSLSEYAELSRAISGNFFLEFCLWGMISAFGYYCLATAKHIIQDLGYCEDFEGGAALSWTVLAVGLLISVATGVMIWA